MAKVGEKAHIARSILVLGSMVTADTNVVSQVRVDFMFQVTDHDKYKAEKGGPACQYSEPTRMDNVSFTPGR